MSIIPLKRGEKLPSRGWKAYQTRHATDAELVGWFAGAEGREQNIGILTGRVSGVIVVDTDNPPAEAWVATNLPETPMRTLTARGTHRFYRYPTARVGNKIGVSVVAGAKLDVCSDGRYVVAPGSVHPSGVVYEADGDWPPIAELPVFSDDWFWRTAVTRCDGAATVIARPCWVFSMGRFLVQARYTHTHRPPCLALSVKRNSLCAVRTGRPLVRKGVERVGRRNSTAFGDCGHFVVRSRKGRGRTQ